MSTYAIYARVSKDSDDTSLSPDAQVEEAKSFAMRTLGWAEDEITVYVDRNLSAWNREVSRPGWNAVVQGITDGSLDGVVVHALDRFLRRAQQLEELITAIEGRAGKQGTFDFHTVHNGKLDLHTGSGRFISRVMVAHAQMESDDKSRRLELVLGHLAREGRPHGGKVPYGWNPDRVTLNEVEAATIRQMVAWVLEGRSLNAVVRHLTEAGIPTRDGGTWHPSVVRRLLTNPRLAGWRTHKGEIVAEGTWEPIIDMDTHRALVAQLTRNKSPRPQYPFRYWLTGLLVCGECGGKMGNRQHAAGVRRYACRKDQGRGGCGNGVDAEGVERIAEVVGLGLLDAVSITEDDASDRDALVERLAGMQARLEQLNHRYFVEGSMLESEWESMSSAMREQVVLLERQVSNSATVAATSKRASQEWANQSATQKAETMAQVFERITVTKAVKGGRFDPTRISVVVRPAALPR